MIGSVTGAALLFGGTSGISNRDFTGGLGLNALNPRYTVGNAFLDEMVMTFLLVYVVFETAVNQKGMAKVDISTCFCFLCDSV
jgi:glycerol uptake facilitator-like aquaporin